MTLLDTLLIGALTVLSLTDRPLPPARAQAAGELRQALVRVERQDLEHQLRTLFDAGERAAAFLPGSEIASDLTDAVFEARCQSLYDPETANTRLRRSFRTTIGDLEFRVRVEAESPEGYPDPTFAGEIELKRYPRARVVRTEGGRMAFWKLFRHIDSNEIAMTSPVQMTYTEKGDRVVAEDMAFVYGDPDHGTAGEAGAVEVVDTAPMLVAAIGCRGMDSQRSIRRAADKLEEWISERPELVITGPMRVMGYNSPMVPVRDRAYEVQMPVRRRVFGPRQPGSWIVVNDGVMGGVSEGELHLDEHGVARFQGELSYENNGGFASTRLQFDAGAITGASSVRIQVMGDGRAYRFRVRAGTSVSYQGHFTTTEGHTETFEFALVDLDPVWRGRAVPDAAELLAENVTEIGFLVGDGDAGAFDLRVVGIEVD